MEVGKEQVAVDLDVIMEFGHNAHDIYKELIKVIETQLEKTTSLKLVELNVQIIDIQTQAEYKNSRVTLQDKVSDAGSAIKEKTSDGVNSVKETASNLTDDDGRVK